MSNESSRLVSVDVDNLRGERAPLFHQYPQQFQPQHAFVQMTEDGEVSADWDANINGTPMDVWHRRTLRWSVPATVKGDVLADLLESDRVRDLLERVYLGHEVDWDGNNHVGTLDEDATEASDELDRIFGDNGYPGEWSDGDSTAVWTLGDWFSNVSFSDVWPAGKTLVQAIEENEAAMDEQDVYCPGDDMGTELLRWAETMFEDSPEKLAPEHIDALRKDKRISDEQAEAWSAEYAG